jgi:hypothetical protein
VEFEKMNQESYKIGVESEQPLPKGAYYQINLQEFDDNFKMLMGHYGSIGKKDGEIRRSYETRRLKKFSQFSVSMTTKIE